MRDALTGLLALFLIVAPGLASGGDMPPSAEEDGDDAEPVAPVEPGTQALDLGAANVDPAIPCSVTMTDGKVHKGNLTHVFRAVDWYGHDSAKNSVVNVSVEPYLLDVDWKDVKSISVSRPNTS